MPSTETRLPVLVLEWLSEHEQGTAPQIAQALGRDAGLINAFLRRYEGTGEVQRVGQEPNPLGRARTIYALVKQDNEEVPEVDSSNGSTATVNHEDAEEVPNSNGSTAIADREDAEPEQEGVTREELDAAAGEVELKAADMDELLAAYCGEVSLSEADSRVLMFVLRMRRVQDKLAEVEGSG